MRNIVQATRGMVTGFDFAYLSMRKIPKSIFPAKYKAIAPCIFSASALQNVRIQKYTRRYTFLY
jgi:hypothetical protein